MISTPSTTSVELEYAELEVLCMAIELLVQRTSEKIPQLAADSDWRSGLDRLTERLQEAQANLPAL